jgi:hypothetical protein
MGSLILLLLVIDRRAKAVARAKALLAVERLAAEDAKGLAERKADLERRRQALHAQLSRQDGELVSQLQAVGGETAAAAKSIQDELGQEQDLRARLQAEAAKLTVWRTKIERRQTELAQAAKQSDAANQELARLTADLLQLERTVADVKAAHEQGSHQYSLVPYHGRQGDNRRPIYLECTAGGLVFHPDGLALQGLDMTASHIRAEVERRISHQQDSLKTRDKSMVQDPYLLMLIRPEGIKSYYHTMAALEGMKVDFGYEFIDADWLLDFPDKDDAPVQPWMAGSPSSPGRSDPVATAQRADTSPSAGSRPLGIGMNEPKGVALGNGPGGEAGRAAGNAATGRGSPGLGTGMVGNQSAIGTEYSVPGIQYSGSGWEGRAQAGLLPTPAGPGSGTGLPWHVSQGTTLGSPIGLKDGVANGNAISVTEPAGYNAVKGGPAGNETGNGTDKQRSISDSGQESGNSIARGAPPAAPGGLASGAGRTSGNSTTGSADDGSNISNAGGMADGFRTSSSQGTGSSSGAGSGPNGGSTSSPGPNSGSTDPGSQSGAPGTPAGPIKPGSTQSGAGGEPSYGGSHAPSGGSAGRSPSGPHIGSYLANLPDKTTTSPAPLPRPVSIYGNRDWVLSIDCLRDVVVLSPSATHFSTAELQATASDNPLTRTVRDMIARRQAAVRPGEPPYRPIIQFIVRPDGLRTFYLAFPALEPLHVPMRREDPLPEKKS